MTSSVWSRGMKHDLHAGGPRFNPRNRPFVEMPGQYPSPAFLIFVRNYFLNEAIYTFGTCAMVIVPFITLCHTIENFISFQR